MTNQNATKKALLSSVLALVLCFSMLLGTTFAWFTDSATGSGNIIKSGTLDVTMEWVDGTLEVPATDSDVWKDASEGAIFNSTLWEPGYTEVRHIKIANEGTLALKYQLSIIANGEVSDLSDVIDVYYFDPAEQIAGRATLAEKTPMSNLTDALANLGTTGTGTLAAGESVTVTIALKMQETAGNEYQNKSIGSNFSIQLLAAQLASETDSIDDQYDADAGYKVIYTFDHASDLTAFDPYNFNGNPAGTGLTVANGKAVVNNIGAFFFRAVDLNKNTYTVEYDVDASALADGESIRFDTGDTATWSGNTPVTVTNSDVTIEGDTTVTQTMGTILHVVHTYALNEDDLWVTTTTVTDGTNAVTNQKVQQPTYPGTGNNVYWDIVGLTATAADKVTFDNFEFYETALEADDGNNLENAITVTPENLATMVYENNAAYQFVGTFDAIDIETTAGYTQVFDGSQATVTGRVSISYPTGVAHAHDDVKMGTERSGSYTLQNFTAESIHAATYNTSVTLSGNKVEFLEIDSANVALNITGNTVDGNAESHTTFQGGTSKYGVYIYAMNYDLRFDGNTVLNTLSHSVGINGRQADFADGLSTAEVTNTISSFSGNSITISDAEANRAALKVWDDTVYASGLAPDALSDGAKDAITIVLAGGNTLTKLVNTSVYFNFYNVSCDSIV